MENEMNGRLGRFEELIEELRQANAVRAETRAHYDRACAARVAANIADDRARDAVTEIEREIQAYIREQTGGEK